MSAAQTSAVGTPTGTRVPERLEHQPALDGFRGFAVLAVVVYHLSVSPGAGPLALALPGGFLGVDLFFILSGFLITSLLLIDDAHRGTTVTARFWVRRLRRLVPALLVLLVIAGAYAVFQAHPWQLESIRRMGLASLLYVSNWYLIFGHAGSTGVLSHTWSLAIEEQWYLVWPFLLGALLYITKGRTRLLLIAIGSLAAASFLCMGIFFEHYGWVRAYHGTDTRACELLVGAALAAVTLGRRGLRHRAAQVGIEIAGFGAVICLAWLMIVATPFDTWMYQWGFVVVAVAGVTLIAAATQPMSPLLRKGFSWRPLTALGLISYGLYLYHVPVISWMSPENVGIDGWGLVMLRLVVMLALAIGSYHLIEMPVRRGAITLRHARYALPAALVGIVVFLFAATTGGYPYPQSEASAKYYDRAAAGVVSGTRRLLLAGEGDVYEVSLAGIHQRDSIRGLAVPLFCSIVGGRAVLGVVTAPPRSCPDWRQDFANAVAHFQPDVAALTAGPQLLFDRQIRGTTLRSGSPEMAALLRARLEEAFHVLTAGGARLILVPIPCAVPIPGELASVAAVEQDPARREWVNSIWRDFAASHRGKVIFADSDPLLCPGGDPRPVLNGEPLRTPAGRLSPAGVQALWDWIGGVARAIAGHSS